MRVLVVEDDEDLRTAVAAALRGTGFAVDAVADLPAADEALYVNSYDCVVFDRKLPGGDSLDYVRARRGSGWAVPVLFLTAMDAVSERIAGLRDGGDDYVVKPFAVPELVARVGSLCRRLGSGPPPVLRRGDLELDTGRHEVRRGGVLLTLTGKEFTVLRLLLAADGQPVPRAELIRSAWDEMADPASNVLDVLIGQLRRKLRQPPLIHTVRNVGYRLEE
ncbi:response regulator transcription factor [Amycolatopsis sp. 195334CR]|uniref:response regulator transcription factor n=1 Tax=Amycolatopsis sp. 195334CR TaxID=2814588 RepID=UPI001A906217|nr:response regulator transcription factor [Amycolatopsis sp. 195334CR]MBN6037046.1 response regulator transcription factor [Amycolatopsis sp. 195334CR]